MEVASGVIKDEINMELANREPSLYPLTKKRGYLTIYECPSDTYGFLSQDYSIDTDDWQSQRI